MKLKLIFLRTTLLFLVFWIYSTPIFAQGLQPHLDPKYGKDSATRVECAMNISLYSEFYKQQNYKDAYKPWHMVYENCPEASINTFIKGAAILKNLIVIEKDAARKESLVDTLMLVYDKRIQYFGNRGTVLSYKGSDLFSYRGEKSYDQVYSILTEAMKLEGKETKAAVVTVYMQSAVGLFKAGKLSGDNIIEAYTFATETLDKATEYNKTLVANDGKYKERGEKELENIRTSYDNVEALFSESGAANCDALIAIFGANYEKNKENLDWVKKVAKILNKTECTGYDLFAKAAEQQYKLEPSAEAAHNLARLFLKREEYTKAETYYEQAAGQQTDVTTKALYYYEWSQLAYAMENYSKVRTLSNQVIQFNATDGKPYIMIGKAYAATKGVGKEVVENNSVFWVAVDCFVKAKQIDPSLTDQANELIATYSKYYPKYEEWFMAVGTKEGDSYTVGGWINVATKVRF